MTAPSPAAPLLAVDRLTVRLETESGPVYALDDVSLEVREGEVLAVVGESGCGKTMLALSILGLLPAAGRVISGQVRLGGKDLLQLAPHELRNVRGKQLGMVFQEPVTSLNPVFTVGYQIGEVLRQHERMSHNAARARTVELLHEVGLPVPERRVDEYPHQLSGGMAQRVMIAMAIACSPRLLIADEPTTALDVTIQAAILRLLLSLRDRLGMAVILITHDLGVVADVADRVAVMYAGKKVETADVRDLFAAPLHPYTVGLLGAVRYPGKTRRDRLGGRRLREIPGLVPVRRERAMDCVFARRCGRADDLCHHSVPLLQPEHGQAASHLVACFHPVFEDTR
jgi:peptide/nickel transport system ATP-binding protein